MEHEHGLELSALVVLIEGGKQVDTTQIISFSPEGDGLYLRSVEPDSDTEYWLFYFEADKGSTFFDNTFRFPEAGWYEITPITDEDGDENGFFITGPYRIEPLTYTIQ